MISRSLTLGLLAAGCVAAAGGGAYVAVRQNAEQPAAPAVAAHAPPSQTAVQQAVAETEAVVTPPASAPLVERPAAVDRTPPVAAERTPSVRREAARNGARTARTEERAARPAAGRSVPSPARTPVPLEQDPPVRERTVPAPIEPAAESPRYAEPPAPAEPQFYEVTIPASAVIGLQIESPMSTDRAQVEDRVTARVTRDVMAGGRVAIPAGSRVLGSVTLVERGGKVKERARLGVRFHTVVLADGRELPLRTEPIFREGESPAGDSSRKIGGAAVGGAILGAILGGGKGAVIGGATGAAGGTAAVMAGDRHPATLPAGTIVTVRLSSPVDVQVEGR